MALSNKHFYQEYYIPNDLEENNSFIYNSIL